MTAAGLLRLGRGNKRHAPQRAQQQHLQQPGRGSSQASTTEGCVEKPWCVCTTEHCSAVREDETTPRATTGVDLAIVKVR